ncbi:hypothetical protein ACJX0J_035556, partial [Zea mays]
KQQKILLAKELLGFQNNDIWQPSREQKKKLKDLGAIPIPKFDITFSNRRLWM